MLTDQIADLYEHHEIDGERLLAAFRESAVLVPTEGADDVLTVATEGSVWVLAFTSRQELARFGAARGVGAEEWPYLTVRGWRLLDAIAAAGAAPTGVAVDLAGERPLFLPAGET